MISVKTLKYLFFHSKYIKYKLDYYNLSSQITKQRGLTDDQAALLISLIGFFNTGGRIISGAITDHPKVDALVLTTVAIFSGKYKEI